LRIPDQASKFFGFINCPEQVGVFHHGCWLGDDERIKNKFGKSSHIESQQWEPGSVDAFKSEYISTTKLPLNIQNALWPTNFFDERER
jgi:hypothetical protein